MEFKQEFLAALKGGQNHESLLELVSRHQTRGLAPEQAYQDLEQLWLEFGFNQTDEGGSLQDNLEYVMEKVWYGCPAPEQ
jgi:hypothetical protein